MSSQQPVFESTATYYRTSDKKWISGTFTLQGNKIHFYGDESNQDFNLRLLLNSISGLEKRQSSFIYAALVITVSAEKHWFASFPNRDTVYNLLELFWRESLLSIPTRRTPSQPKEASSSLGKELLSLLHESEATLVGAANALSSQGRQLEESQMLMQDINTDLNVAEKFLRSMSLAHTVIGMKGSDLEASTKDGDEEVEEEARLKSFKVSFSERSSRLDDYERGTLAIADTITIVDEAHKKRLQISNKEVEKILVTSPWAFSLEYASEWANKTCHVICPQLAGLLKFLKCVSSLKNKVAYENEAPSDISAICSSDLDTGRKEHFLGTMNPQPLDNKSLDSTQMQLEDTSSAISDQDMEQISNVLGNLQALAIEVTKEQQDQMDKINSLITDVDKTELRINVNNKNINKKL
ncbi:hypothetical protein JTE90_008392 [Oedothorax gibbosus]|uniref:Synaptosomal-associated protein 47 n=1 Tax=Oedothorax gibbosus TaxID=931172 RepID=A0AAV6V4T8_9ARAC|nr:hypothetical protein JTE90_008392 [Oedothorax gibbosus]